MRTGWIGSACPFSSRPSPRSFDMLGGALSSLSSACVVVCCSWLVLFRACPIVRGLVASRAVVASFLLCLLRACLSCRCFSLFLRRVVCLLIPFCPIVVSLGSPLLRQVGRGGLRLGRGSSWVAAACCLPWRGRGCGGAVRFPSLLACPWSPVDGVVVISVVSVACRWSCSRVGVSRSFRPILVACLFGAFSLSPAVVVPCLLRSCRRGSSWAVRRLVSSSWFLLVVGRRCPSSSRFACRRRSSSPCLPSVASSVVFAPFRFRPSSLASSLVAAPSFLLALAIVVVRLLGVFAIACGRLVSGCFCIIPVRSGIEHFFRNNAV